MTALCCIKNTSPQIKSGTTALWCRGAHCAPLQEFVKFDVNWLTRPRTGGWPPGPQNPSSRACPGTPSPCAGGVSLPTFVHRLGGSRVEPGMTMLFGAVGCCLALLVLFVYPTNQPFTTLPRMSESEALAISCVVTRSERPTSLPSWK